MAHKDNVERWGLRVKYYIRGEKEEAPKGMKHKQSREDVIDNQSESSLSL